MSSDEIMEGFVITLFSLCVLSTIGACIRMKMKQHFTLKQSPSMEDLNSVGTDDPSV